MASNPPDGDSVAPLPPALEAQLRLINVERLEGRLDIDACLRKGFDAIVKSLIDSEAPLTEELLSSGAAGMLFDWAVVSGWADKEEAQNSSFFWDHPFDYRHPPPIPPPMARLGSHPVQDTFRQRWLWILGGRMEHWRAQRLDPDAPPPSAPAGAPVRGRKRRQTKKKTGKGKARKPPVKVIVELDSLMSELNKLNETRKHKGQDPLILTAAGLAAKCKTFLGLPRKPTWEKLLTRQPVRGDVRNHLVQFFKRFGHPVTSIPVIDS